MSKTLSEFVGQPDPLLVDAANLASNFIIANPAQFEFSAGTATEIGLSAAQLQTAYEDWMLAKSALDQAVKNKAAAKTSFAATFTGYLGQAIANPDVSEATLAAIGLRKREPATIKPLRQPLNFTVTPNVNGYIVAKWKRNENATSVSFVMEELQADGSWEIVWIGPRLRCELQGYTPGVEATFRVYATRGGEQSPASNNFTIYGAGGAGELQIAA